MNRQIAPRQRYVEAWARALQSRDTPNGAFTKGMREWLRAAIELRRVRDLTSVLGD